jgi:hypothetical protein
VLDESHAILLSAEVFTHRPQQAGPQRNTHDRQIARNRIGERNRLDTRKELRLQRRIDKRERDGLVIAASGEQFQRPHFIRRRGGHGRNPLR